MKTDAIAGYGEKKDVLMKEKIRALRSCLKD